MAKSHKIKDPDGNLVSVSLTPARAIKSFCTECFGFEGNPKECTSSSCPLFPFRGKSLAYGGPRTRELTPEQKEAYSDRIKKMHDARKASKKAQEP